MAYFRPPPVIKLCHTETLELFIIADMDGKITKNLKLAHSELSCLIERILLCALKLYMIEFNLLHTEHVSNLKGSLSTKMIL